MVKWISCCPRSLPLTKKPILSPQASGVRLYFALLSSWTSMARALSVMKTAEFFYRPTTVWPCSISGTRQCNFTLGNRSEPGIVGKIAAAVDAETNAHNVDGWLKRPSAAMDWIWKRAVAAWSGTSAECSCGACMSPNSFLDWPLRPSTKDNYLLSNLPERHVCDSVWCVECTISHISTKWSPSFKNLVENEIVAIPKPPGGTLLEQQA